MKIRSFLTSLCVGSLFFASSAKADDSGYNPLGPVRLGALVGVGFPSPLSADVLFKYKDVVGANLELGMFPEVTFPGGSDIRAHQEMFDLSARVYPFKNDFFLGCGVGKQWITVTAKQTDQGMSGDAVLKTDTTFVSPRLGFVHRFGFGLALGMDVGVELPVVGSTDVAVDVGGHSVAPPKAAVDAANTVRTAPIPIVHLLQLGYIF